MNSIFLIYSIPFQFILAHMPKALYIPVGVYTPMGLKMFKYYVKQYIYDYKNGRYINESAEIITTLNYNQLIDMLLERLKQKSIELLANRYECIDLVIEYEPTLLCVSENDELIIGYEYKTIGFAD